MQIHKSVIKRVRIEAKRRTRRTALKGKLKDTLKKFRKTPVPAELPKAIAVVHRMAQKGIIHRNTAFRLQSRLARLLNKQAAKK
jgi:ribosomal protein S20